MIEVFPMAEVRIGIFDFFVCAFAFGISDRFISTLGSPDAKTIGLLVISGLFGALLPFLNPRWN